jgi:hypothetical protein
VLRKPDLKPSHVSPAKISSTGIFNLLHDRPLLND